MKRKDIQWMVLIAALILMLNYLLAGCGGPTIFAKAGAGKEQFDYDNYECEQAWERTAGAIAFRQDPLGNAYFGFARNGEIQKCLEHKGWQVMEASKK